MSKTSGIVAEQMRTVLTPHRAADLALHRSLSRLRSSICVMNTGAHPDDEQNGLLAWLRFGLGMRTVIACSTRGEGGQNALGPERGGALAVIRTREMEEAARIIDADVAWLGHGPDDPVHDFGFSKNGDQTFARWGKDRIIERMVRAYRTWRPDIVIPTFLDVPGQHGHHRAMTQAAYAAIQLAASQTAFPEHMAEGLRPWRVAKYYLPAWSGGGSTYDDEIAPPPVTLNVVALGDDPVTGVAWDRIGEWSRLMHASQGMGEWLDQPKTSWPLHRVVQSDRLALEDTIMDGLPRNLEALAPQDDIRLAYVGALRAADAYLAEAVDVFPDRNAVTQALLGAAHEVEQLLRAAPPAFLATQGHRLERKAQEIDAALFEAAQVAGRLQADPSTLAPGGRARATLQTGKEVSSLAFGAKLALPLGARAVLEGGGEDIRFEIGVSPDAALSPQFEPQWLTLGGNGAAFAEMSAWFGGHLATALHDFDTPLAIQPATSVSIEPEALIVSTGDIKRSWPLSVTIAGTSGGTLSFQSDEGWSALKTDDRWHIHAPSALKTGQYRLGAELNDGPAYTVTAIDYPHIGNVSWRQKAELRVLALDLALPLGARVGYVGGGADHVGLWLRRMGVNVTDLTSQDLAGDLSRFTTIIVGVFGFGQRADLSPQTLRAYVEAGGHLVTLYHRPVDNWQTEVTPPRPISIGSPSLRWRVTDPGASVKALAPNHTLLCEPNRIGPADWAGWDKERGLYFASSWDPVYQPLLAMNDMGEQPLEGALLSGQIGKGRHTHVALVLHHQLDKLVPGTFRLLANLIQPAGNSQPGSPLSAGQ